MKYQYVGSHDKYDIIVVHAAVPAENAGALDCPSVPLWAVARALQNQNLFARRIRRMEFILSEAEA